MLGIGVPFLFIGLLAAIQMARLLAAGVRTRAKVVGYETGADTEMPARYPIVEFRDEEGKIRRVQLGSGVPATKEGETEIVYHPGNPDWRGASDLVTPGSYHWPGSALAEA